MEEEDDYAGVESDESVWAREQREFQDAVAAYNNVLGQVSNTMPMPSSYQSTYAARMSSSGDLVSDGPELAQNSPWIRENHPALAAAADRVADEQADLLALDEPIASHAQCNCSIICYTAEKFYEYAAMAEMIYRLATDDDFRRTALAQMHRAFTQSAFMNLNTAEILDWHADNLDDDIEAAVRRESGEQSWMDRFALWAMGYDSEEEFFADQKRRFEDMGITVIEKSADELRQQQETLRAEADRHYAVAKDQVRDFFIGIWNDFKTAYEECGLAHAVARVAIDGVFLVGEGLLGAGALRGLKFAYRALPGKRHMVDLLTPDGQTLGTKTWKEADLEAKYGSPDANHVGGQLPDRNRTIPDREVPEADAPPRNPDDDAPAALDEPDAPPPTNNPDIPDEELKRLRSSTPTQSLRNQVNEGQPVATKTNPVDDPWIEGQQRTARLEADHIVPYNDIIKMDGFSDLSDANRRAILNDPENFHGLSRSANASRGDLSFEDWTEYKRTGTPINPALRQRMIAEQARLEQVLQQRIYDLLRQQRQADAGGLPFRE